MASLQRTTSGGGFGSLAPLQPGRGRLSVPGRNLQAVAVRARGASSPRLRALTPPRGAGA